VKGIKRENMRNNTGKRENQLETRDLGLLVLMAIAGWLITIQW
jgi:hypothetical protein